MLPFFLAVAAVAGPDAGPPNPWKELEIPGKAPNAYRVQADGEIEIESRSAVSILYREIAGKDRRRQRLSWRWRVDRSVPATDLGRRGADDRDLAVHVWFSDAGEAGDWPGRLFGWIQDAIGYPAVGRTLTYVWGGDARRGDRLVNPHPETDGAIIVLRPSGTPESRWFTETVDIAADYEAAFGAPFVSPHYIAISSDSDDTRGFSRGRIADLELIAADRRAEGSVDGQ